MTAAAAAAVYTASCTNTIDRLRPVTVSSHHCPVGFLTARVTHRTDIIRDVHTIIIINIMIYRKFQDDLTKCNNFCSVFVIFSPFFLFFFCSINYIALRYIK